MPAILVVDDEKVVRVLLREMLEKEGFEVREAAGGVEAGNSIRANPPDLLITDIFMPDKSGLELIMDVRHEYPDMKIMAISGDSISRAGGHKDCLEIAKCLGSKKILEKPFKKKDVVQAVRDCLQG